MSTTKTTSVKADKDPKERNWAIPDQVVSLEEIQSAIKSAEKGPFMKVQADYGLLLMLLETERIKIIAQKRKFSKLPSS
jgi:hypothetical protein